MSISFLRRSCARIRPEWKEILRPLADGTAQERLAVSARRRSITNSAFETIRVDRREAVQVLTLDRPEKLNALSSQCSSELLQCLKTADTDDSIHVTILTGSGKVFCAGADIEEMSQWTADQVTREQKFYEWTDIQALRKPTIAAVNGAAIGGGCELAMLCDILIASENAYFSQPEVNVGVIPGMGGTQRLIRAVGKSRAMEMILTGDAKGLTAADALDSGLVSRVVPEGKVLEEAMQIAQRIAKRSSPIIMKAKKCINDAYEMGLSPALASELRAFWSCFEQADSKEGLRAFLEKREPHFKHR